MMFKKTVLLAMLLCGFALTARAQAPAADGEYFDVDVNDTPARAFFMGLVSGTRINMLVHPQVTGSVTLQLKHVTLQQVLEAAKALYGYDYRPAPTGYIVLPATVQTRIFSISYLDVERMGGSRTAVSSGQLTQGGNTQYGGNNANGNSSSVSNSQSDSNQNRDATGTAVATRHKADFWTVLETTVRAMIGAQPDRNVVVNAQSGVVVVRASPNELRDVEDYLRTTEKSAARQVVLEAKIVEVQLNDGYQAGINWAAIFSNGNSNYGIGQSAPPMGFDQKSLQPTGNTVNLAPNMPITGFPIKTLGGAITAAASTVDFAAYIELLSTQGNARVLSSPRVSTLNNQKALIKAGTDEFFVTDVSSDTVTGTASSTSRDIEFTPFFTGVALDVTPQIGEDDSVILHIHPSVSDVTDQVKTITVSGSTDTIPLAFSQIRESDSVVKAKSGQTIVIGGLMREQRKREEYKVPGLGSIPVLGRLFRSEQDVTRTVELVILLRPIVVRDNDWEALVNEHAARAADMTARGKIEVKK